MFRLRRLPLFAIAFIIALMQAALPVSAYARMARQNTLTQEICSPSGSRTVTVDADGIAHEAAPDSTHGEHCPWCTGASQAPVPLLIHLHEAARHRTTLRVGQTCFQAGAAVTTPPSTGPPAGS
jgi:Protein of unknown function (DUF2946)